MGTVLETSRTGLGIGPLDSMTDVIRPFPADVARRYTLVSDDEDPPGQRGAADAFMKGAGVAYG